MYLDLHVKYALFLSDFNEPRIFSTDSSKILISKLTKILPMEAELFHERRKDRQI